MRKVVVVEEGAVAAKISKTEGKCNYKSHGMDYTINAEITFKDGKIDAVEFTCESVKIPKAIINSLTNLALKKKLLDAVKITSSAVQENAKKEEKHLVETVTGAFHAALRDYQNKQRGKEHFEELYDEVDKYYEGCKPPELREMSEACEHSEKHSKH